MKRSSIPHLARAWTSGLAVAVLALALPSSFARAQSAPGTQDPTAPAPAGNPAPVEASAPAADAAPADSAAPAPGVADGAAIMTPVSAAARMGQPLQSVRKVRLDKEARNVLRTGPGDDYAIVGVYPKGTSFPVIAKRGDWYGVQISETQGGWVHASLCHEFDDLSDLEFKPNPRLFKRTGTFVLTGYAGAYAFDRKSNSLVLGGRLGYYVFDRVQAEAGVAWTHVKRPAEIVENLFDLSLEAEDFQMLFYNLNLTWELLPGRQMVPFVSAGAGASLMQGDTETSFNFGAGTTLFLSRRTSKRWEVRDYHFRSGSDAARVSNDNVEFALGTQYLF
jgi:outer membrane beta-barrel protein